MTLKFAADGPTRPVEPPLVEIRRHAIDAIRDLVYRESGIALNEAKSGLVEARLQERIEQLRLKNPGEYLALLQRDSSGAELTALLDRMTTNVTSFFRDPEHIAELDKWAIERRRVGGRSFRVWSAGCSSGQEPYSIAIRLAETLGREFDWRVLATDLSTRKLDEAARGVYAVAELATVPTELAGRWFHPAGPGWVEADAFLKTRVVVGKLNLLHRPFPMRGPFDVIFCRYVMMYFDTPVRMALLQEYARLLAPGGYLFIGRGEAIEARLPQLQMVRPSVFRRV